MTEQEILNYNARHGTTETAPVRIEIHVERRLGDYHAHASFDGVHRCELWGVGNSSYGAIGSLIATDPQAFGIAAIHWPEMEGN